MEKLIMPIGFFGEGSIVDIEYPYEDSPNSKLRPAVIIEISDNKITVVMLKITSKEKYDNAEKYPYAVKVQDLSSTGLSKDSWILADKELIVNGNNGLYLRGHLSDKDLETVKLVHNAAKVNNCIVKMAYDL